MIRQFLVRACRVILGAARAVARGVAEGNMPHQMSPTATEENIAWGTRWVSAAVASVIAGEAVSVSRADAVMLVLFAASVIAARRGIPRPSIVYQAAQVT